MIRERVGVSHEGFKDLKSIKISPPDSYGGEDDIEVFDNWIAGLLRWLRIQNVCGRQKDSLRIDLCGSTLKGLAADWFAEEVESFHRSIDIWQFEDVVCALYKRFIHRVTAQSAADKYKKTKFIKAEGALAFYNNLKRHANRMVQRPDDYSFRRDFLLGLPQDLVENLMKSRRVSAEHTPIEILLEEVKAMESNLLAVENHRQSRREVSHSKNAPAAPSRSTSLPYRTVRFVRKDSSRSENPNATRAESSARPGGYSRPPRNNDRGRQPSSRPPGADRNRDQPRNPQVTVRPTMTSGNCFNCGKPGHLARDCKEKPRMFAAQVIDEDALATREAGGNPPASNDRDGTVEVNNNMEIDDAFASQDMEVDEPYGSQLDSDQGYNPSDYDTDGFRIADDESMEGDSEVVFIRSLHTAQGNVQVGDAQGNREVSIRAMHSTPETDTPRAYRNSMRKPEGSMKRPLRETAENMCLTAYIEINGVKAYTLFDSGSTTDSVSPDFTRVARLHVKTLEQPVTLQLGCVGSRSKINYGTEDEVKFASITCETYLDIANLDRYDCIVGTPFMRRHKIALDFGSNEIVIRGKLRVPAIHIGGGTAVTTAVTPRRAN
jgi:hypothetical protein